MTYKEFCKQRNKQWERYLSFTEDSRKLWINKQLTDKEFNDANENFLARFSLSVERLVSQITSWDI